MTINEAPVLQKVSIAAAQMKTDLSDVESRLMHLGFIEGAKILVKRKSPLLNGPLLVEVRGRVVALTQTEANLVRVELCP
jgi:Fe2+ transport system protein FeoA